MSHWPSTPSTCESLPGAAHTICGSVVHLERRAVPGVFVTLHNGDRAPHTETVIVCPRCGVVPPADLDTDGPLCGVF